MKIIKKYGLTVALSVVVIISFVLSIILWANPSYEHVKRSGTVRSKEGLVGRPLSYTYTPTQAIQNGRGGRQYILVDSSVNVISEIVKNMHRYHATRMKKISHGSAYRYLHYLDRPRSLELSYQSDITTPILNSVVKGGLSQLPKARINRIILPLNNHHCFYLLRDHDHRVYRVSIPFRHLKGMHRIVGKSLRRIPVRVRMHRRQPLVTYLKSVQMPQYDYLINRQRRDYYVTHLLSGAQRISRTSRGGQTIYSNGSDRRLSFDKYQNVKYGDDRSIRRPHGLNQTLYYSYHRILPLNLSLDGIHYFYYNPHAHLILYRRFVEGFPIFNSNQFGTLGLTYGDDSLNYRYSLDSLQIPIPNKRKAVRLPKTKTVVATLKAHGYDVKKIQSLDIGYEWRNVKTSKVLANLVPGWFIKYNHHWINYDQIQSET